MSKDEALQECVKALKELVERREGVAKLWGATEGRLMDGGDGRYVRAREALKALEEAS